MSFQAFTVWQKGLRFHKIENASKQIHTNLFMFNSALRQALLNVRQECARLGATSLLDLTGEAHTLEEFIRMQNITHIEVRNKIEHLSAEVLRISRIACDLVVDEFLKANNIVANHKMTFMERASLRSECKHLTRFLRLLDIMVSDFLRTLMIESLQNLLVAVTPASKEAMKPIIKNDLKGKMNHNELNISIPRRDRKSVV